MDSVIQARHVHWNSFTSPDILSAKLRQDFMQSSSKTIRTPPPPTTTTNPRPHPPLVTPMPNHLLHILPRSYYYQIWHNLVENCLSSHMEILYAWYSYQENGRPVGSMRWPFGEIAWLRLRFSVTGDHYLPSLKGIRHPCCFKMWCENPILASHIGFTGLTVIILIGRMEIDRL